MTGVFLPGPVGGPIAVVQHDVRGVAWRRRALTRRPMRNLPAVRFAKAANTAPPGHGSLTARQPSN